MKKSTILFLFLKFYRLLWRIALPILKKNARLRDSIKQRISSDHFKRADVWIQAASAGECNLAIQLVKNLSYKPLLERHSCFDKPKQLLLTSTTAQGLELLSKSYSDLYSSTLASRDYNISNHNIFSAINIEYFPFDICELMDSVICKVKPLLIVLLETELWPSLLFSAKKNGVRVVVINGRMSKKSHRNYMVTKWLWSEIEPYAVFAISNTDAQRFKDIFPHSIICVMPNMKFDSIIFSNMESKPSSNFPTLFDSKVSSKTSTVLLDSLPLDNIPFSIMASIRKEEEEDVVAIINQILEKFPDQIIGLFPRHIHRIDAWKRHLSNTEHKWQLLSEIHDTKTSIVSGTVVLWDIFGELKRAYSFATVAFVGGSLRPLGGHNFIEPLICGAVTVTGPFIDDFSWVGEEIFTNNIVKKAANRDEIVDFIVSTLKNPPNREDIIKTSLNYIATKQGGTSIASSTIIEYLSRL